MNEDADIRAQERVGTVLNDKWMLEQLLGVGGMAAVYAARHRNGARAAVKILHSELSRHAEVRERFQREGYAANRVEHPGVVKVLDDDLISEGEDAGTAYLVMELLEGESLQDRIERGMAIGEREFLCIAESVLDVLEAAHARGVVHRDLKPENLFLLRNPGADDVPVRIKVLDFGLARLLQGQAITTYGLALGTPSFMSPEQAAGRLDEIDGRTDLFALGATGFRVRTGRRIHEGFNAVELVTKMANMAAPPIRKIAPDVSEPFARVIDRALQFRRDDRYPSAAAMRDDARKAISQLDGVETATRLAVGRPPSGAPPREKTIQISESELQYLPSPPAVAPPPTRDAPAHDAKALPKPERRRDWPSDSVHIPRHRSVIPWLALLVALGIGSKLWLDSRQVTLAGSALGDGALAGVAASATASTAPSAKDGGPDAATSAAPSPSHRAPPPPAAPSAGHKLPVTHHAH